MSENSALAQGTGPLSSLRSESLQGNEARSAVLPSEPSTDLSTAEHGHVGAQSGEHEAGPASLQNSAETSHGLSTQPQETPSSIPQTSTSPTFQEGTALQLSDHERDQGNAESNTGSRTMSNHSQDASSRIHQSEQSRNHPPSGQPSAQADMPSSANPSDTTNSKALPQSAQSDTVAAYNPSNASSPVQKAPNPASTTDKPSSSSSRTIAKSKAEPLAWPQQTSYSDKASSSKRPQKKGFKAFWRDLTSCCRGQEPLEDTRNAPRQNSEKTGTRPSNTAEMAKSPVDPADSSQNTQDETGRYPRSQEGEGSPSTVTKSNQPASATLLDANSSPFPGGPVTPSRSGRNTPSGHGTPGGGGTGTPLPPEETGDVMSGSVVNPGAEGSLIAGLGARATGDEFDRSHQQSNLLGDIEKSMKNRKCLVLDLDETLVHSSFKVMPQADFVVPVEIESQVHNVYVIKRPGVDAFMRKMGELYEVVVFTASLSKYADPVLDILDIHGVVKHRLFRESCFNHKGNYVKDLAMLGRSMDSIIIIDNSPASYIFHPNNAVPISSWFNDPHDTELTDLTPFLEDLIAVDDVRAVLEIGL